MIYRFTFEGDTPSKKNQKRIFKGKNGKPFITASSDFKAWHKGAVLEMKLQMTRITGVTWPLPRCKRIFAKLFYEDRRRRDSSNTFESIMDLMVDAGILADDNWIVSGPTAQFPELRPDRPGWELMLEVPDLAPGLAQAHRMTMEAKP